MSQYDPKAVLSAMRSQSAKKATPSPRPKTSASVSRPAPSTPSSGPRPAAPVSRPAPSTPAEERVTASPAATPVATGPGSRPSTPHPPSAGTVLSVSSGSAGAAAASVPSLPRATESRRSPGREERSRKHKKRARAERGEDESRRSRQKSSGQVGGTTEVRGASPRTSEGTRTERVRSGEDRAPRIRSAPVSTEPLVPLGEGDKPFRPDWCVRESDTALGSSSVSLEIMKNICLPTDVRQIMGRPLAGLLAEAAHAHMASVVYQSAVLDRLGTCSTLISNSERSRDKAIKQKETAEKACAEAEKARETAEKAKEEAELAWAGAENSMQEANRKLGVAERALSDLEDDRMQIRSEKEDLERSVIELRSRDTEHLREIRRLKDDLSHENTQYQSLSIRISDMQEEMDDLRAEQEAGQKRAEEAGRLAVEGYKASSDFQESHVQYSLKAYEDGFGVARRMVQRLFPDLDLTEVDVGNIMDADLAPDEEAPEDQIEEEVGAPEEEIGEDAQATADVEPTLPEAEVRLHVDEREGLPSTPEFHPINEEAGPHDG